MTVNESEREWQAERDADILMEYSAIKSDSKRYKRAINKLKENEKNLIKKLDVTKKLINKKDVK